MNKNSTFLAVLFLGFAFIISFSSCKREVENNVVVYNYPADLNMDTIYEVNVNDQNHFVIGTEKVALSTFSFDGEVSISIKVNKTVNKVDIRPKSKNINYTLQNNTIIFSLNKPENLSIEINDDISYPLFLFANAIKTAPVKGTEGLHYFESGKFHDIGEFEIKSNESVYLEPGSIIRGSFIIDSAENINISGYGILDATTFEKKQNMLRIISSNTISINDFTILNAYGWVAPCFASHDISYDNIKIVAWKDNDDGIDIVGSHDITVKNCFLRDKDDCIVVKGGAILAGEAEIDEKGMPIYPSTYNGDVYNILVENTTIWNGIWGNAFEIGFELQTDSIHKIVFRDCDIIHVEYGGVFSVHNADYCKVENILFEDIRVEDVRDKFIDFRIGLSIYSGDCPERFYRLNPDRILPETHHQWIKPYELKKDHTPYRGTIRNITFKDITLSSDSAMPRSVLHGYNEKCSIEDLYFENFVVNGEKISNDSLLNCDSEFAKNLFFK